MDPSNFIVQSLCETISLRHFRGVGCALALKVEISHCCLTSVRILFKWIQAHLSLLLNIECSMRPQGNRILQIRRQLRSHHPHCLKSSGPRTLASSMATLRQHPISWIIQHLLHFQGQLRSNRDRHARVGRSGLARNHPGFNIGTFPSI